MPPLSCAAPDDADLKALFCDVLLAIEGGSSARLETVWAEFERALAEQFTDEERTVLADLLVARPREARLILEEHRYLRGRLAQLRARLPKMTSETARVFLDELRAHGRHQARVLRRWVESRVVPTASSKAG
jgi:hypothetical protein